MVESLPYKQVVGGSNPSRCTRIYVRNIFYNHILLDIFRDICYNSDVVWSKTSHVVWVRGKVPEWSKGTVCKTVKPSVQIRPLPPIMEAWPSGWRHWSWKPANSNVPWVRISPLPPVWSVGRVGRRHFPAKKAYLKRVSLVRIQYTPPLDNVFFMLYTVYHV